MPRPGSDAERISAIADLDAAVAAKQPGRSSALAARDAARAHEANASAAVQALDTLIRAVGTDVLRRAGAVYLNGRSLDRGSVQLGNEVLRYSGWRGTDEIALGAVWEVELGTSSLPPRAGIPLIGTLFPGRPRAAGTLLVTVREAGGGPPQLAVLADLRDADRWRDAILAGRDALWRVAERREELAARQAIAAAAHEEAREALALSQAQLDAVEREIAALRAQRKRLQDQQREVDAARKRAARQASASRKAKR